MFQALKGIAMPLLCAALFASCGGGSSGGGSGEGSGPVITNQPTSVSATVGAPVALAVTVNDSGAQFQWRLNGVDVPGATASSLVLPHVAMQEAGVYTVVVSDGHGQTESQSALLSVRGELVWDSRIDYRALRHLNLSAADPAFAGESDLSASLDGGELFDFALGQYAVLHLLAPEEREQDGSSILQIQNANQTKSWRLTLNWASHVNPALQRISESGEDDGVTITVQGVAADGFVSGQTTALAYDLAGAPRLSPDAFFVSLSAADGELDIGDWFSLDAEGKRLSLRPEHAAELLQAVRTGGSAQLGFSLSTADFSRTVGFAHNLTSAEGSLDLRLVNPDGSAASQWAGMRFMARNLDRDVARMGTLDSQGQAQLTGLPAGSYFVEEVALHDQVALAGFADLYTSHTAAQLVIKASADRVGQLAPGQAGDGAARAAAVASTRQASALRRPGNDRTVRVRQARARPLAFSQTSYEAQVASTTVDTLMEAPLAYDIPTGTQNVRVRFEVYTSEYPNYVTEGSTFNDEWRLELKLPGGDSMSEAGKVNDTHKLGDTVAYDKCVDVSSATQDGPAALSGVIGAKNVVDEALPTRVHFFLALGCGDGLVISEFTAQSKGSDSNPLLKPKNFVDDAHTMDGNLNGQYLALPISVKLPASFGLPSTLKFQPADATLTQVDLLLRSDAGDTDLGTTYLTQGTLSSGQIKFSALNLEPLAHSPIAGPVQLLAVVHGTLANGKPAVSEPLALKLDGKFNAFTPLYLASERSNYQADHRFGTHTESGNDAWSTASMFDWAFNHLLKYNDLSAGNIKQTATGRSVLDHAGHSDGQQADLRYWDGAGGFTDQLGGAESGRYISELAVASLAEQVAHASPAPKTAQLVAWIEQNRTQLETYTALSEVRRVYVGNAFITQLLIQGKYPSAPTTAVPGIAAWAKPAKVLPQASHLDHWHVNTSLSHDGH
jgi:hypothetical protein